MITLNASQFASQSPNLCRTRRSLIASLAFTLVAWCCGTVAVRSQAAPQYAIQVGLGNLTVGEPLGGNGNIVILRPSPGDNFWYRLPYRVQLRGELPPGIALEPEGAGFHNLARFIGTPTAAGTYRVTLQATMADGLLTQATEVVFFVEDPKQRIYTVQSWGTDNLLAGSGILNAGLQLVSSDQRQLRVPAEVNTIGLPDGLSVEWDGQGAYTFTGVPTTPGTYPVSVEFRWRDTNGLIASSQLSLVVAVDDPSALRYRLTLQSPSLFTGRPADSRTAVLRQGVTYTDFGFQAPWFYVEDQFGRRSRGPFTLDVSGVPEGLSFSDQGFLVGRPLQPGLFDLNLQVTLPSGAKTNIESLTLQVRRSLALEQYAGTYDCNIERSDTINGNLGGRLRFIVGASGQVSGFLLHNTRRFPFTSAAFVYDEAADQWVITPPGSNLLVRGSFFEDGSLTPSDGAPLLGFTGLASQSQSADAVNASSSPNGVLVSGWRATRRAATSPSPYADNRPINIVFVSNDLTVQNSEFGGAGFMTVTVSSAGNATVTVWAPDGSPPVSLATTLVETNIGAFIPTYAILLNSSGASSLMGKLFVNLNGDAAGELSWFQRPSLRGSFPEGVSLITYEGVIGSRYAPQPQGLNLLGLEESIANAQLDLIGEEVPAGSEVLLSLERGRMQAMPAPGTSVSRVRLNHQPRTGIVTGTMILNPAPGARARTVTFRGITSSDRQSILGHYSVPKAANARRTSAGMMMIRARSR